MPLGLFPLLDQPGLDALFSRLTRALREHGYEHTTALPEPGKPYHLLREPTNVARYMTGDNNAYEASAFAGLYRAALGRKHPDAVHLYEIFHLGRHAHRSDLARLLGGELVDDLVKTTVLVDGDDGKLIPRVRATGIAPLIQLHDTASIHQHEKSSFVFCGRCSSRLVNAVRAEIPKLGKVRRSLDLCTGSGIQALNMSGTSDEIWGSDLNPRAVAFATANARANGIGNARFLVSNLFEKIEGRFDLITANTPFLLLDEGSQALDGYGGAYGMEVELRLIEGLKTHLEPGGTSMLVVSSAFVDGRNLLEEKLRDMFAAGGWEIDLFPISQYYSKDHWRAYESVRVEKCVLYVMRARSVSGSVLAVRAHDWPHPMREMLEAKVKVERQIARRRYVAKHGTDALG